MRVENDVIGALNDAFRQGRAAGQWLLTPGVQCLGTGAVRDLIERVKTYRDFDPADDPYGEHDFGVIVFRGERYYWKIDCYDLALAYASPDPADPALTRRVLTLMRADEY